MACKSKAEQAMVCEVAKNIAAALPLPEARHCGLRRSRSEAALELPIKGLSPFARHEELLDRYHLDRPRRAADRPLGEGLTATPEEWLQTCPLTPQRGGPPSAPGDSSAGSTPDVCDVHWPPQPSEISTGLDSDYDMEDWQEDPEAELREANCTFAAVGTACAAARDAATLAKAAGGEAVISAHGGWAMTPEAMFHEAFQLARVVAWDSPPELPQASLQEAAFTRAQRLAKEAAEQHQRKIDAGFEDLRWLCATPAAREVHGWGQGWDAGHSLSDIGSALSPPAAPYDVSWGC